MKIASILALLAGLSAFIGFQGVAAFASEDAPKKESESTSEGENAEKAKDKDTDISGGLIPGDPIYVHMAPILLPVIDENGAEQIVSVLFDIQVNSRGAAEKLLRNMPRVRDALMRHLYGGFDDGILRKGKLINVGKLKNKAVSAISEVIDRESIRDVLVQGLAQRML